jgi:hypothetical protein
MFVAKVESTPGFGCGTLSYMHMYMLLKTLVRNPRSTQLDDMETKKKSYFPIVFVDTFANPNQKQVISTYNSLAELGGETSKR